MPEEGQILSRTFMAGGGKFQVVTVGKKGFTVQPIGQRMDKGGAAHGREITVTRDFADWLYPEESTNTN